MCDIRECDGTGEFAIEKKEEKLVLKLRCEQDVSCLCKKHHKKYVEMFSCNYRVCSDPLDRHKKSGSKYRLSEITVKLRSDMDLVNQTLGIQ